MAGFVIRNALLTIEATDHAASVRRARLVPEVNVQTYRTLVPDGAITDVDSPLWTLELQGLQDWETGGLARYLHDNHGTAVTVVLGAQDGTGKRQATFEVIAQSVPFGGDTGVWAEFEVSLGVVGQPVFASQS